MSPMSESESTLRATILDLRGDLGDSRRDCLFQMARAEQMERERDAALDVIKCLNRVIRQQDERLQSYLDEIERLRPIGVPLIVNAGER